MLEFVRDMMTKGLPQLDSHLLWDRIEAEGETAARHQAQILEGLSDNDVLDEVKRQQEQVEAARMRSRRRRRK